MFRGTADPSHSVSKNSRTFQQKRRSSRNWVDVRDLRCHASSYDFKTASVYALLTRVSFNAVSSTAAVAGCPGRCWISMSFSWRDRWDDKRKTLYICMQPKKKKTTPLNSTNRNVWQTEQRYTSSTLPFLLYYRQPNRHPYKTYFPFPVTGNAVMN